MKHVHLWITIALALALLATNAWWLYQAVDQATTEKYHQIELDNRLISLQAALRTMPSLATELERNDVVMRAKLAIGEPSPFEKDGATVIAPLTFTFDSRGKLKSVGTIYGAEP